MGCLNSNENFSHWFGNIHLSGPCNRSCYFCIGQHMMAVDSINSLDVWPLSGIEKFAQACKTKSIQNIYVTGTNTDPLLYKHTIELKKYLQEYFPALEFGIRTNGVLALKRLDLLRLYNKGSLTVCSFDDEIYKQMMGQGKPPDIKRIVVETPWMEWKINVVLGPENFPTRNNISDLERTIFLAREAGIKRINFREPYGQLRINDPFVELYARCSHSSLGMPHYHILGVEVWYWDVHYVEVESVNLFANGHVSTAYPITKGVDFDHGEVLDQSHFVGGRVRQQWIK